MDLVSQSEAARRWGVSPSAVSHAVKAGRLTTHDGVRLDFAVASIQWEQNRKRRPRRARRPDPELAKLAEPAGVVASSGAFWDAKTRRETAEASLAELKEAETRGELVRRAEVERELASVLIALRESLEALADRLSALMAAETDAAACRALLRTEHRHAMAGLVAYLRAEAGL